MKYRDSYWYLENPSKPQPSETSLPLVHEETEQSDDELLSLSSQHSSTSTDKLHGASKLSKRHQEPSCPLPPSEEVDLLGLDGSSMSKNVTTAPSAPPSNSDLLSDLFGAGHSGGPSQGGQSAAEDVFQMGGTGSAQSTPRRSVASASPSLSPRIGEGNFYINCTS